jgi:hypothetical protein
MKQRNPANIKVKIALLLILVLSLIQFAVLPFNRYLGQETQEISLLKQRIALKTNYLENQDRTQAQLAGFDKIYQEANELFWQEFEEPGSLMLMVQKKLEKNAATHALAVTSANWGTPTGNRVVKAPVELNLTGLPENMLAFIKETETNEKFYSIDTLQVQCRSRNPEARVKMTVSVYGVQ